MSSGIKDRYNTYADVLDSARQVLGQLKTKTESDTTYIWWSFCFFMAVVAYIVLKRLKVFRVIIFSASWTWWGGESVVGFLRYSTDSVISVLDQLQIQMGF